MCMKIHFSIQFCMLKHTLKTCTVLTNTIKTDMDGIGGLCYMNIKLRSRNNLLGDTLDSLILRELKPPLLKLF